MELRDQRVDGGISRFYRRLRGGLPRDGRGIRRGQRERRGGASNAEEDTKEYGGEGGGDEKNPKIRLHCATETQTLTLRYRYEES